MLVMLGDDLGTTFILLVIFLALLWVIGTPARLFIGILALMVFAMVILIIVAPYRLERITGFFNAQSQSSTAGWQTVQGTYAVGSGGWFGRRPGRWPVQVGLGPEHHDRLHLRHHRRGARAGRHRLRDPAVRRARLCWTADRPAGA